jgi:hypothetical protein
LVGSRTDNSAGLSDRARVDSDQAIDDAGIDYPARWRGHLQELFAAKGKLRPVRR